MVRHFIDFDNIPTPCSTFTNRDKCSIAKICPTIDSTSVRTNRLVLKKKSYKQTYSIADLEQQLLVFYAMPIGSNLTAFCRCNTTIPKSSFHHHFKESGLANLQAQQKSEAMAKATLIPVFHRNRKKHCEPDGIRKCGELIFNRSAGVINHPNCEAARKYG